MLHHHLGQVVNGHHKLLSGRETKTENETVMNYKCPAFLINVPLASRWIEKSLTFN